MDSDPSPDLLTYQQAESILHQLAKAYLEPPLISRHQLAGPTAFGQEAASAFRLGSPTAVQIEDHLRQVEVRYRTLVEQLPAVTFMASLNGGMRELYVSPQIEALLGFSQREWLENPVLWYTQLHPDDRERWQQEFAPTCVIGRHFNSEYRFLARNGDVVWVHGEAQMVRDEQGQPLFLQGVAYDITARKKAEESLRMAHDNLEHQVQQRTAELAKAAHALEAEIVEHKQAHTRLLAALHEKELLLKEIHHRVKNNLQIISSLLSLQSGQLTDPQALQMFRDSQSRIRSMALLHERLYRSEDLASINAGAYIHELAVSLCRSYGSGEWGIELRTDVRDVFFDIDTAIPCGLIINELVTNSLKHAFRVTAGGAIHIALTPGPAGNCTLMVGDTGPGFPEGLDLTNAPSLGLQLVSTLANQLGGNVTFRNQGGAQVAITFPAPVGGGALRK